MTDDINTTDFDIFALPPVLEDEKAIAFKCEVDELRGRLHTMVQTAPTADDRTLLEKEEWSREWKLLIVAQHTKVDIQLTVADKQIGQSGNKIRDTLQGHISAMKEAAVIQADQDARANNNLHAEQDRQAPAEKDDDATVETSKGTNEVPDEVQDKADNGQEDDTQAINSDDAQPDNSAREGDTQDGHAQTDQDGIRQLTPCVPSDKDVDIVAMAPKPAESVGPTINDAQIQVDHTEADEDNTQQQQQQQKSRPIILSDTDDEIVAVASKPAESVGSKSITVCESDKEQVINAIPCKKCLSMGRMCYRTPVGNVCANCKRLKVKCSLAS
ncbi:hypothetical protein BDR03DRAFT_988379, partial [Suillus americanus]